jgi:outer membrane protein assembly factor BamB
MTRRKVDGSPVVCGDKVVFGSGDGRVYMLRLADGEQVWSYEIGRSIFSSPAVADGVLITASLDGSVYAFGARPTPVEDDR